MKIEWHFEGVQPWDTIRANMAHAHSLGLPAPQGTGCKRLAILAGGPSAALALDEIKAFAGDVWIVGSAFQWATKNGIEGTYFNIDPSIDCADDCRGARKAILGSSVHPSLFEALQDAEVFVFDLVETKERLNHGVTTATAVPELAILCGYAEVVFYGCEGSFEESSHAYRNDMETNQHWMYVKCDGKTFKTRPDYFSQAEFLATMIRAFPQHLKEKSGGFLRAMVNTMDYDITHMTRPMHQSLHLGETHGTT